MNNKDMLAEFNKTQQFAEQKTSAGLGGSKMMGGATRLPGPHYILEHAHDRVVEQEKRINAANAAVANRWFHGPKESDEPAFYTPPELDFDSEYGPPGVPMLLAYARNDEAERPDTQIMHEADTDSAMLMQKIWLASGLTDPAAMAGLSNEQLLDNSHVAGAGALGMLQMNPQDPSMMFAPGPPNPHAPQGPPHPQFMAAATAAQPGMFMDQYAAQYAHDANGNPEQAAYMQQPSFG